VKKEIVEKQEKDKLLYVSRVSDWLSCSRQYVYTLIREGRLRAVRRGSYLRVFQSSVEEFLSKNELDPEEYYE